MSDVLLPSYMASVQTAFVKLGSFRTLAVGHKICPVPAVIIMRGNVFATLRRHFCLVLFVCFAGCGNRNWRACQGSVSGRELPNADTVRRI